MKSILLQTAAIAALALLAAPNAFADDITSLPFTLGAGKTGTIADGATLSIGGSTVAISVTGNNATLINLGALDQTGTGRAIRDNTGVAGLTIFNGCGGEMACGGVANSTASIQTMQGDVIQMAQATASVTLTNYGQMISLNTPTPGGNQVVDFSNITSGDNIVNNHGLMRASEADAVRPGVNGVVNNWGTIKSTTTTGSSSDGVDAQNNSGVQITNYSGGLIEGGRHGITGGQATVNSMFTMSVTNEAGGTIQGDNGSGINIDAFNGAGALETVTVVNHGTITGDGVTGDGDGVDVDGLVNIMNTGTIRSLDAQGTASEGLSVGGGMITNSGTIEGSLKAGNVSGAVGRGITLTGNDLPGGGREPIYADAAVINEKGGLIQGDTDSGIAVIGDQASGNKVTIDNEAGATIKGGGTTTAAIDASASFDPVTITNAGTIDGSSSGKAITLSQDANNTVTISGGAASVLGDMDGGAGGVNKLNFDMGKGNSFSYAGAITDFASTEIISGRANLSGSIAGPLTVDAGAALSPGVSGVGALSVGDATLDAGGSLVIDLDPTGGVSDILNVTGTIALNGANLVVDLLSAPTLGEGFDIVDNDGTDPVSGVFSSGQFVNAAFDGSWYRFSIEYAYNADSGVVGNDIRLTSVAVPEPSTWVMMGLGGLVLIVFRPRRLGPAPA